MFIEEKGREVLAKGLYRNFVLHVCNLFEFGVLEPGAVFTAIHKMQKFVLDKDHTFSDWPLHSNHWKDFPKIDSTTEKSVKKSVRKDFSGIFSKEKIQPYVVLSPLRIVKDEDCNESETAKSDNNEDETETEEDSKQTEAVAVV